MSLPAPAAPNAVPIGERIRRARKERGWSQAELARRVGVSQPAIATWESGVHDPRQLMLAKVSEVLGAPFDWLAAGARSSAETDRHGAAAYIRRPLRHVPVIANRSAALFAKDPEADPHAMAEDYIPVTAGAPKLFAIFLSDEAVDLAFPPGSLVVVNYGDRRPQDGSFCLAETPLHGLVFRRWRAAPAALEPHSTSPDYAAIPATADTRVIGCALISIRFH